MLVGALKAEISTIGGVRVKTLKWPADSAWLDRWAEARNRMLVSADGAKSPSIVCLDVERRWVKPEHRVGEIKPEDLARRWLRTYRPSSTWEG